VDFAAEDIDDAGVLEKQFSPLFTARHGKFLLDVPHKILLLGQKLELSLGNSKPNFLSFHQGALASGCD
jgi:hypothetical protein